MIRLTLVGPLPPPIGGATRHFQTLVRDLKDSKSIKIKVINSSRGEFFQSTLRNCLMGLIVVAKIVIAFPKTDVVSLHASTRGIKTLGVLVVLLCKVMQKPCVLRCFGGSLGDQFICAGKTEKWWLKNLRFANAILIQTKRAIQQIRKTTKIAMIWFCAYLHETNIPKPLNTSKKKCRRFIYLGHLWKTKGLITIFKAAKNLPEDIIIDVYGPEDDYTAEEVKTLSFGRVNYMGIVNRDKVLKTLRKYHCLLLPTFHPGEGYPGVIAEAFTMGLPVITTNWLGIPEIVDSSCGLLIKPNDDKQLKDAILTLYKNNQKWKTLCLGAQKKASLFEHDKWANKFEKIIEKVLKEKIPN